jgi:hypothetical protein
VCAILARPADAHGMRERLQQESVLPAETRLVLLGRHDRPLRAALHAVPGSRVYLR